jgi:hypothetical protein
VSPEHNPRPTAGHRPAVSPFRQPKAVWAVAYLGAGTAGDSDWAGLFGASLTAQLICHARCEVHLVPIMADRHLAAADTGR